MATTSERLREIISIRNIKQVEIIEKTGINKGALSSYLSGRYVPKQDNIYKLAKVLDVNPAWLMGLDVPMEASRNVKKNVDLGMDDEQLAKAVEMFQAYTEATPDIQSAIEILLKKVKPITDSMQNSVVPAIENLQDQLHPVVENMQTVAKELPHLKGMKPTSELLHLKKDTNK